MQKLEITCSNQKHNKKYKIANGNADKSRET